MGYLVKVKLEAYTLVSIDQEDHNDALTEAENIVCSGIDTQDWYGAKIVDSEILSTTPSPTCDEDALYDERRNLVHGFIT